MKDTPTPCEVSGGRELPPRPSYLPPVGYAKLHAHLCGCSCASDLTGPSYHPRRGAAEIATSGPAGAPQVDCTGTATEDEGPYNPVQTVRADRWASETC